MRILFATLVLALSLCADEPLRPLLEELRSDDAARRNVAREALLKRDSRDAAEIRAFGTGECDIEARAAALEVANELEFRDRLPALREVLRNLESRELLPLIEQAGPAGLPDLVEWIDPSPRCQQLMEETYPVDEDLTDSDMGAWLRRNALAALRAVTLADFGLDAPAWRSFAEAHRGHTWSEVRLSGLEASGFPVRDPDARRAGEAWSRAWEEQQRADLFNNETCQFKGPYFEHLCRLGEEATGVREWFGDDAVYDENPEWHAAAWFRLNGAHLARVDGRLVTTLQASDLVTLLGDPDAETRCGALHLLKFRPGDIPAEGWALMHDNYALTLEIMSLTSQRIPAEHVPHILGVGEDPFQNPAFARFLDPSVLRDLVKNRSLGTKERCRAIRWLLLLGDTAPLAMSIVEAGGRRADAYSNPAATRFDAAFGKTEPLQPIFLDAFLGDEKDVDSAEKFVSSAGIISAFQEIALALAARGRRSGLEAVLLLQAVTGDKDMLHPFFRAIVEDAPAGDDRPSWAHWMDLSADRLEWDPVRGKWELPK